MDVSVRCLDRELVKYADKPFVHRLALTHSLNERDIDNLVVAHTDHHIALSHKQSLHRTIAYKRGKDAVVGGRRPSALQVSEDGHTHIKLGILMFHTLGIIKRTAGGAFTDDDNATLL